MTEKKTHFGLTQAEFDNLMQAVRYGIIIVITVLITFTVVAGLTGFFGYVPPQPANYEEALTPTSISE